MASPDGSLTADSSSSPEMQDECVLRITPEGHGTVSIWVSGNLPAPN